MLWVLAATVVSGVSGYLVIWLVARSLGAADYSVFGVFWSGLFLIVGILFGIQQETTRSTADSVAHDIDAPVRSSMWVFAACAAIVVILSVGVTAILWAPATLGVDNVGLVVQIALGAGGNAVVATISGVLAGAGLWRQLAAIIAIDGVLRILSVGVVLGAGGDTASLAWAVILPYPISLGLVFLFAGTSFQHFTKSGLAYRRLIANSAQTMLGASATAVIINGFPLLLAFFALATEKAELGALILAITITRAPVLVPLMALQSYLITRFTVLASPWRLIGQALALICIVMAVLGAATLFWGTWAFASVIGADFALSTSALVPLVVSSGFVGSLCVTGPALLARGEHRSYAVGWVLASVVAVGMLFVPVSLEGRAALALSLGPIVGLVFHLAALRSATRQGRRA
ncbi:hypothetical protein QN354_08360 [Cryobacterium sp. 5I3]|nr:hypothetical protein [Cryobacterium sp. 5I3]